VEAFVIDDVVYARVTPEGRKATWFRVGDVPGLPV
jgi:hypothetical protein